MPVGIGQSAVYGGVWWVALTLIGLAAVPVTVALFRNLPDRGYAFSKPVGFVLVAYAYWVIGLTRLVPNTRAAVVLAALVVLAVNAVVAVRRRVLLAEFLRRRWRLALAMEGAFALLFVAWAVVRSNTADIINTEQPMDFMMLQSVLRSDHFPPQDLWYAGEPLSYYHFGYVMVAAVVKLTGIPASVAYNLALASTAAMGGVAVMGVVFDVVSTVRGIRQTRVTPARALAAGVFGVALLLFMANLVPAIEYLRVNGIGGERFYRWIGIEGITAVSNSPAWYPTDQWWWWRSSRVINTFVDGRGIDYTITEFPFHNLMVGDLHPHGMALPFTLMVIGLSYNILRSPEVPSLRWLRSRPWLLFGSALLLGSLGFLNTWDLPTFAALFMAAVLLRAGHARAGGQRIGLVSPAATMALVGGGALLLYAPFYLDLHPQVQGVAPLRHVMTRPLHFVLIWGLFLLLNLTWLGVAAYEDVRAPVVALARRWRAGRSLARVPVGIAGMVQGPDLGPAPPREAGGSVERRFPPWVAALPLVPFLLWAAIEPWYRTTDTWMNDASRSVGTDSLTFMAARFWNLVPIFLVLMAALALLVHKAMRERRASAPAQFLLLLLLLAFGLAMVPELFYLRDPYQDRMNTVFKAYFQMWALLAVAGAVSGYLLFTLRVRGVFARRVLKPGLVALVAVLVIAGVAYIPPALYDKFRRVGHGPTLDGAMVSYLYRPREYEGILWLRDHAGAHDVIVEGVPTSRPDRLSGDFQQGIGRISMWAGVPAVLGWPYHEYQWRGSLGPIVGRYQDVRAVYTSTDMDAVRRIFDKYSVTYVVVGSTEQRLYGRPVQSRFEGFMDVAFQNGGITVYRRRGTG